MSDLSLEIGKFYRDDDGWEVYVHHPEGGCVTLHRGTERECEQFVASRGRGLTAAQLFGRDDPEREITLLREVADAAASLRDARRVGVISLVARDERQLDRALDALDALDTARVAR